MAIIAKLWPLKIISSVRVMMRVENNNVSGQNHDLEQIDLIDLLVQLWRGKMTIIISVIVAIALAIGYLAVAKEKWTSTAIVTQPDVANRWLYQRDECNLRIGCTESLRHSGFTYRTLQHCILSISGNAG